MVGNKVLKKNINPALHLPNMETLTITKNTISNIYQTCLKSKKELSGK